MENLLNAVDVAQRVGCSPQTLSVYYKFKAENPFNEYSLMLPDFIRIGKKRTRYWHEEDVQRIIEFREAIPQGRNGLLGSITQRFCKTSFRYKSGKADADDANKADASSAKRISVKSYPGGSYIDKVEELLYCNEVEPELIGYIKEQLKSEYEWRIGSISA